MASLKQVVTLIVTLHRTMMTEKLQQPSGTEQRKDLCLSMEKIIGLLIIVVVIVIRVTGYRYSSNKSHGRCSGTCR